MRNDTIHYHNTVVCKVGSVSQMSEVCDRSAEYRGSLDFENNQNLVYFQSIFFFPSHFQCLYHRALMFCYIVNENPSTARLCTIHIYVLYAQIMLFLLLMLLAFLWEGLLFKLQRYNSNEK